VFKSLQWHACSLSSFRGQFFNFFVQASHGGSLRTGNSFADVTGPHVPAVAIVVQNASVIHMNSQQYAPVAATVSTSQETQPRGYQGSSSTDHGVLSERPNASQTAASNADSDRPRREERNTDNMAMMLASIPGMLA
jgi:hypothetical protein